MNMNQPGQPHPINQGPQQPGEEDPFRINTQLFKFGGVMGRMDYFKNWLKAFGLLFLVYFTAGFIGGLTGSESTTATLTSIAGIFNIPFLVVVCSISYRRLRDIRGTTENDMMFRVLVTVALLIPIVNLITDLVLLFTPGKITSGLQHQATTPMQPPVGMSAPQQAQNQQQPPSSNNTAA